MTHQQAMGFNMRRFLTYLILPLIFSGCKTDVPVVSIMAIVSSPQDYHREEIIIRGYLVLDHENRAIYFSREQASVGLSENAIWISLSDDLETRYMDENIARDSDVQYFQNKYVMVRGKFNKKSKGHMGAYAGEIVIDYIADMHSL